MKELELTIYATKWPYIEFTSCNGKGLWMLQLFYDYIHTDSQKPDLVDQKEPLY